MDGWTIGNKAAWLFYVISATFFAAAVHDSWLILVYLVYLILNAAILVFRGRRVRTALECISAAFVIVCAYRLDPAFFLLLPANAVMAASTLGTGRLWLPLAALLPAFLVPVPLLPLYLVSAGLSCLMNAISRYYADKLRRLEEDREKMREDVFRLNRSLNENKEYIRQSEYTIKLEERNRLSQQIHDDIGHSMAGALIQMEAARTLLKTDGDKASELIGNAIAISKEGLERIRLTLKDMKPKAQEMGINRMRLFADELAAKRNLQATLSHDGDIDAVTPIQWKIIQENATEAVTNSLKYADATAIHIEIQVLNKFVKSVVSDNGRGAEKVVKGLGIVGMEERAASAGGMVIVDGTKGFSVTTLLPRGGR